jgi:hypothetical protein
LKDEFFSVRKRYRIPYFGACLFIRNAIYAVSVHFEKLLIVKDIRCIAIAMPYNVKENKKKDGSVPAPTAHILLPPQEHSLPAGSRVGLFSTLYIYSNP